LPFIFNFALQHALGKIQENKMGLKMNETHQLLAHVGDRRGRRLRSRQARKRVD
jgi:hypothetical protein